MCRFMVNRRRTFCVNASNINVKKLEVSIIFYLVYKTNVGVLAIKILKESCTHVIVDGRVGSSRKHSVYKEVV